MKPTPDELLKFTVLSRIFCGNEKTLNKKRIPKIHQPKIDELKELVQKWIDKFL